MDCTRRADETELPTLSLAGHLFIGVYHGIVEVRTCSVEAPAGPTRASFALLTDIGNNPENKSFQRVRPRWHEAAESAQCANGSRVATHHVHTT